MENIEDKAIVISNAHISLPYTRPDDYLRFNLEHPEKLYAFQNKYSIEDSLKCYKAIDDVFLVANIGQINRTSESYEMDITKYCQKLINKEVLTDEDDLWIAPLYSMVDENKNPHYDFDNRTYCRILLNGPGAENHPKLTITYTVMNK